MSMRLLINIPKEFEQHFQADRFEDSLHRLNTDAHLLAGLYEKETALMLIDAFKNAVLVPPHGRLIDANVLMENEENISFKDEWHMTVTEAFVSVKNIAHAPTIIEAEEEEHGRD